MEGGVRQDIDAAQTANGMVVIVISLLMATMQTGADDGDYELVATDVESVLHAATRPVQPELLAPNAHSPAAARQSGTVGHR